MSPRGNGLPLRVWKTRFRRGTSAGVVATRESFDSDEEGTNHQSRQLKPVLGFFSRLIAIMPGAPLLGLQSRAQEDSAYRAIPGWASLSHYQFRHSEEELDDIRKRDKRKGKVIGARLSKPDTSLNRGTSRKSNTSSRGRRLSSRSQSNPISEPAGRSNVPAGGLPTVVSYSDFDGAEYSENEEAVEVVDDSDKGSDHDPLDNSLYPQVRASVSATDDSSLSINSPRMWILSLLFSLLGSAINLFFSLRYPAVAITPVIALVLVHPVGRIWDTLLKRVDDPPETFEAGDLQLPVSTEAPMNVPISRQRRLRLWLARGKWNEKEHACVYISSNVSFGFAFATDVIVEQAKFYHQDPSVMYQLLLTISTQILGYAFAGITRRFLVRPSSMIWPGILMSTAMFSAMHRSENKVANGWKISRYKFFIYVFTAAFAWYFLPGLLMPALSYFNVITWFAPENVFIANLFGVSSGLGLFSMTFDWAQIAYIGSPLLVPWWAAANVVGGLIIVMWIIAPVMYYTNVFYSSYMPILSSSVFDNTGKPYDVSKILTSDFLFDQEAYAKYSKVFLPMTYVLSYAVQFAGLTALITHTTCWHGKDIWQQSKKSFEQERDTSKPEYQSVHDASDGTFAAFTSGSSSNNLSGGPDLGGLLNGEDVHYRLMRRYEDTPISWYIATFVTMLAVGIFVVEYYPIHLPWYGLLLALSITTVLFIPVGIVMAISNQHSSLYLISQLICGVVFPGRPVANMVFVTYCYISSAQGIKFSSDLKLGHYMKIPPKLLFKVQLVATLISSFTQIGVLNWMFANIPGLCTVDAINGFICPIARVHFNGSILWGVVGPERFFGKGALYRPLIWAFLIGAIAPIIVWLIGRCNPTSLWRKVHLPVLFGSLSWIPPATGLNFSVWALTSFTFNFLLARRAPAWWAKYTMTLSAALDSGLAFGVAVVFFCVVYPGFLQGWKWWGTEVYKEGCDWRGCAWKALEEGERFGG